MCPTSGGARCRPPSSGAPRPIDDAALIAHCRHLLADYKTPRHVVVVEEALPRSMSGKVLRRELRAKYQDLTTQER